MMKIFENIEKERHLEILNSHPDLAIEKKLTEDSKNEQKNASLNQCTNEEFIEFKNMLELCQIIIISALKRKKSCGAHFRSDFNENKHT